MAATSFAGRVYGAVAARKSAEDVRRAIDACAPLWDEQRRAAAVNETRGGEDGEETPLERAHDLKRGDLVGRLLEEGADASQIRGYEGRPTTALALCVCYDLPETLRALLRKGGHDANQRLKYYNYDLPAASDGGCTLAHVCMFPSEFSAWVAPPPRLACLEVLVREGGVSVDARDERGKTPLHWAANRREIDDAAAVDLLVRLGADTNARDKEGQTPIFECAVAGHAETLQQLLEHGASPDLVSDGGYTPLMFACLTTHIGSKRDAVLELARRSSPETRRAVVPCRGSFDDGLSAIDFVAEALSGRPFTPVQKQLVAELLVSGASVLPKHAAAVLPIAVSHGLPLATQRQAELSRRPAELCSSWPAHEAFAGLAMDVGELRAAESEVEAKRRRLMELEQGILGSGFGMESSSSGGVESGSDDQSGSESDDDESESGREGEEEVGVAPSGGG